MAEQPGQHGRGARAQAFCLKNFLPLGFLISLIMALAWPTPGDVISSYKVGAFRLIPTINVITIFIVSGLTLKTDEIKNSFRKEGRVAFLYGLLAILVITPCLAFATVRLPFEQAEFSYGLAVFCVVPTTLTSGVTLVTQSEGNGALALLLTVVSNLVGVVSVPYWLKVALSSSGDASGVKIDAVGLIVKLVVSVLIPLIIGKAARELVDGMKPWVTSHKPWLSVTSNGSLVFIVYQTLCRAADDLKSLSAATIFMIIACGIAVHLIYLSINWPMANVVLHLPVREMKAVVLMGSQKTLPLSITIISFLGVLGTEGFMTIPCIIGHMSQLFIDSCIQTKWAASAAVAAAADVAEEPVESDVPPKASAV
ncbi:unnamed protein product [Chrysoparadoxa australica]